MELLTKKSLAFIIAVGIACDNHYDPRTGDILFQDLESERSEAIKLATESGYSHCGIVAEQDGEFVVIEAVGPVREIGLFSWIENGKGRFSAFRLKEEVDFDRPIDVAEGFLGLPYDHQYGWGDDQFYCSELVYKAFQRGCGIALCELQQVDDYRLGLIDAQTRDGLDSAFLDRRVVAPGDLARSPRLRLVYSNMVE